MEIDQEVKRLVTENYERAKRLLTENMASLKRLAEALLEKEVLDGSDIDQHSHAVHIPSGSCLNFCIADPGTPYQGIGVPGQYI